MVRVTTTARRWGAAVAAVTTATLLVSCANGPTATTSAPPPSTPSTAGTHSTHAAATPPPAEPLRAGERFVNLTMPKPYTPAAPNGGTDEYRCFIVDPKLTASAFLTGSQFLPQNAELVHHAIFFRIGPDDVAAAQRHDAETPGDGWTCFGDAGVGDDPAWVAHWAPGANETLLAPNVGHPMPPGSQLVMQLHYNLLTADGKPVGSDQSAIRLRLADGSAGITPLRTDLLAASVELPCAPGETGPLCDRAAAIADVTKRFGAEVGSSADDLNRHCNEGRPPVAGNTQHCDHENRHPGTLYAVAGHMHLLGRSIKVELNPGKPNAQTLLDLPVYNFDEQAVRPLAKPVEVKAGDTFRVTCTHDAGLRKLLPQLSGQPPRYVVWGDGTSDEMCLGLMIWAPKA